jgi:hypothetical protein
MAVISPLTETCRHQVTVAIRPWFSDHCFAGKVILPAVETMAILAAAAKAFRPEAQVRAITEGRFDKFLAIDPDRHAFSVWVELTLLANGDLGAALVTRTTMAHMTRVKEHGRMVFATRVTPPEAGLCALGGPLRGPIFTVDADRIYQELVPFGPAYRNITGTLRLTEAGGEAMVLAPDLPGANGPALLGSPFPLDAAFHAACAWSQRYHGIVAFPVAVASRIVRQPTRPGEHYAVRFKACGIEREALLFDLEIRDGEGTLCEEVSGLRMRDVSGGRLQPPPWIRAE